MKNKKLDKVIEQEYYAQANGLVISILDIPKLFDYARKQAAEGKDVGAAVGEAIKQFCKAA